jgi:hypothetical protein
VSGRSRTWLVNVVLLLSTVLVCALALEGALRVIFAHSMDFSMEMWKYATTLKRPVANPKLSFTHVPNGSAFLMGVELSTNSMGLRDREYTVTKPEGVRRILMLGDSTTLGWGVPLDQTVAKILEGQLNQAGSGRFEVLNAGIGNYDTVQETAQYEQRDRKFHPDIVVLEYFINDAEPVPVEHSSTLLERSYLMAFAVSRYDAVLRLLGARPRWDDYYASLYR